MIPLKPVVYCPVGSHVELGYLTKGEVCSYVCTECQWIFTWNKKGVLMPPVKLEHQAKLTRYCDRNGCHCR